MASPASILIVEDEPLITMMLEDFLDTLGYRVAGTADGVEDALALVASGDFDAALLDVNLRNGEVSWPVADAIAATGTPFVIATGGSNDTVPDRHSKVPVLGKPYTMDGVRSAFEGLLAK